MLNKLKKLSRFLRIFMLMMTLKLLLHQNKLTLVKVLEEIDHMIKNAVHSSFMLKVIIYNLVSVLFQVFNLNVLIV